MLNEEVYQLDQIYRVVVLLQASHAIMKQAGPAKHELPGKVSPCPHHPSPLVSEHVHL